MSFLRRPLAVLPALAVLARPAGAIAQTAPSVDARTWAPSMSPSAGLVLEPTSSPGSWEWNTAAWLSYAQAPVVIRGPSGDVAPLRNVLGADLIAGLGFGDRAAVGVDLPVLLVQEGASGLAPGTVSGGRVPASSLGDVAVLGKATLVRNDPHGMTAGFGLAAVGTLTLPTGDRASFAGDGSATVALRMLAEYALGPAAVRASLGYTLRTAQQTWDDAPLAPIRFGDELPWSFGASLRPKGVLPSLDSGDRQTWELALHGWLPASPVAPFQAGASALSPVLVAVDDRVALGGYGDVFVLGGVDVGLDHAVGVPAVRFVVGVGWAPRAHDSDHDGIPDDHDECPDLPEDRDGIQDDDGCPEDDADGDGILDTQDACPLVPGVWWNDSKKNGCPAPDSDGDGVADPVDACPAVKGVPSDDPKKNGCPADAQDIDHDGVPDDADKCPDQPEDKDGNEDYDGCPDDDDHDGIADKVDACPHEKGERATDPARNGCPNPDRDGDTYDNDVDQCPDDAEVFNGVKDDDGCPDDGGRPLVTVQVVRDGVLLQLTRPVVPSESQTLQRGNPQIPMTLRAVAQELNRRPDWTLAVGVRPATIDATGQRSAIDRAGALAEVIVRLTHRPSAEAASWDAVKQQPGASSGVGLRVLLASRARTDAALVAKTPGDKP